jgi:hypothetical protein
MISTQPHLVSGFTIVRNAEKLGYPFKESVRSVLPLCDEFWIGCGDSEDATLEFCHTLVAESGGKVKVFETTWTRENQSGGFQLKKQTDEVLRRCAGKWCLYIQADELMHEADFDSIRAAMEVATPRADIDGLLFDYLHFYGNYDYEIRGRNWYRREVRLFKNGRGISAYRDAQGFRGPEERKLRVLPSGGRVFHYGYVRTPKSLGVKSGQMAQWWGNPGTAQGEVPIRRHVGLKRYQSSHPAVMKNRIATQTDLVDPMRQSRHWDWTEVKNAITLAWESIVPVRIGEFRNYELP